MKIKVVLRTGKINKQGQSPLMLRFTHDRTTKFVALGLSVEPHYWDKDTELVLPTCPERITLQSQIDRTLAGYHKKIQRLEALDIPVNFETLFDAKPACSVGITIEDGFKAEIERLESLGKINSATKHKYALQVLDGYKPTTMALEAIDLDYLKGLELYLRQRGNKDNSIATRFAIFKAIYNKAVKEGKVAVKQNPFSIYQVGSLWAKTRKRAIDKDDIQRLIDLEITEGHTTEYRRLAKDLFLFSYFTAGMNFGDIARLRYKDILRGRVNYSRHKTQKLLSFQLVPMALQILEKYGTAGHGEDYIFPILNRHEHTSPQQIFNRLHKVLRKVNRELKVLGEMIGLGMPLTTYVARHTYATVLKRSGVSVALISESLGHSDLSTTQIYLDSFENSQIDAAMQHLL
ncbi:site-specific integrase [Alistipes putredinis]|jgi:integrase|uniref:site-specific integrase n=1 Tax=Alistipes putredinis TaxID=28117 RepID=UPI001C3795BE|nr:site-specific integrase [Alistipes putredinis]MBV4197991.1 site-specific integrase [Alistipes putredinis]MDE8720231.1 site-specific integrase [Alistipes putredinis]